MITFNEMTVHDIVADFALTREDKIEKLRGLESEARGLQRAASESPMNAEDGWDSDLREVRLALDRLGWKEPLKGAATL